MSDYIVPSEELERVAKNIFDKHDMWGDFPMIPNILYVMSEKRVKGGGTCKKAGASIKMLMENIDFVVTVDRNYWYNTLSENEREPFLYHLLLHIGGIITKNDKWVWKVFKPDVCLFYKEVEEYGLWKQDIKTMGTIIYNSLTRERRDKK